MGFTDNFRKRMMRNGFSNSESIRNSSFTIANSAFADAPNYRVLPIYGTDETIEVRVIEGKNSRERFMLLRPDMKLPIGSMLIYQEEEWMVFDLLGELFSPKLHVQLCNETLRWIDASGEKHEVPVVINSSKSTKYDISSNELQVEMLEGGMYAYVRSDSNTRQITPSYRFIFGGKVYEIAGVDNLTYMDRKYRGIIQLTCRISTARDVDDTIQGVADNSHVYQSIKQENGTKKEKGEGGSGLW